MNGAAVLFSRASDEWQTPPELYAALDREFRFQWDAAATLQNTRCGQFNYFGPPLVTYGDALAVEDWCHETGARRFWLNPPYSQCRAFMAKAAQEAQKGALVVCLVPARTDTRWFHEHVWDVNGHHPRPRVEVRFLRGRLRFGGASDGPAPFPSMIVIFHPHEGRD